jgi:hypothetical protein
MTIIEKINKLDKACDNSLAIIHYCDGWEIHSFKDNTPLDYGVKYPYLIADTFKEVINLAYKFVFKENK